MALIEALRQAQVGDLGIDGSAKIVEECSLPLTGRGVVNRIITDLAVIDVTENGLVLVELAHGVTMVDVRAATAAPLILDPALELT